MAGFRFSFLICFVFSIVGPSYWAASKSWAFWLQLAVELIEQLGINRVGAIGNLIILYNLLEDSNVSLSCR